MAYHMNIMAEMDNGRHGQKYKPYDVISFKQE